MHSADPIRASPSKKPRQAVSPLHHVHDATPGVTAEAVEDLLKRFQEHGWDSKTKANWTFPRRDRDKPRSMRKLLAAMQKEFNTKFFKTTLQPPQTPQSKPPGRLNNHHRYILPPYSPLHDRKNSSYVASTLCIPVLHLF